MGCLDHLFHPKSFFGVTSLRNGALILALVEFIFTFLGFFGIGDITSGGLSAFVSLICCVLGVYGIIKNKPKYVFFYYVYVICCAIVALIFFIFSFLSFDTSYIIINFLYFIISLYNWRVVSAYYHQMKSAREEAAVLAATEAATKF
ncbi:hypothetical protein PIROE2DRAFT_16023 [Piromyces sp. E2]|nr:hypothetical protein PIROE2DRAFT_16023 [Piromyces sp. E2]|eukprot:OUM58644.1 hypothetical protein PIROE2DRAFT_16023 [Piromyces sp. E2]